jgi:dTDP-4-dehydrorhamnose reductase
MLGSQVPRFASDYITGVVSADDLSVAYLRLITSELLPPIVHFASDGFFSRSQLATTIKGISALHSRMRFSETTFSDLDLMEPRARDTRLAKGIAESKYRLRFEPIEDTIAKKVRFLDGYFQNDIIL